MWTHTHADVGPSYFVSVGALLAVGRDCISIERPKKAMLNRRKEIAVKIQWFTITPPQSVRWNRVDWMQFSDTLHIFPCRPCSASFEFPALQLFISHFCMLSTRHYSGLVFLMKFLSYWQHSLRRYRGLHGHLFDLPGFGISSHSQRTVRPFWSPFPSKHLVTYSMNQVTKSNSDPLSSWPAQ